MKQITRILVSFSKMKKKVKAHLTLNETRLLAKYVCTYKEYDFGFMLLSVSVNFYIAIQQ